MCDILYGTPDINRTKTHIVTMIKLTWEKYEAAKISRRHANWRNE